MICVLRSGGECFSTERTGEAHTSAESLEYLDDVDVFGMKTEEIKSGILVICQ